MFEIDAEKNVCPVLYLVIKWGLSVWLLGGLREIKKGALRAGRGLSQVFIFLIQH